MSRILAIDYGLKRTGIAVTDPMKIIAQGLTTVESAQLIPFLKNYLMKEPVELIILGEPRNLDHTATHATALVNQVKLKLEKEFPEIPLLMLDERFTSKMASRAMIDMGMKKQDRRNKALIDEISATIILQGYLEGQGT
jgi:putative Holliday junction resolvase